MSPGYANILLHGFSIIYLGTTNSPRNCMGFCSLIQEENRFFNLITISAYHPLPTKDWDWAIPSLDTEKQSLPMVVSAEKTASETTMPTVVVMGESRGFLQNCLRQD